MYRVEPENCQTTERPHIVQNTSLSERNSENDEKMLNVGYLKMLMYLKNVTRKTMQQ